MATIEISDILKTLRGEHAHVQKEFAKLDKAIGVLRELSGTNSTPNQHGKRRTLSAAASRKIAAGQRKRWAKVKQQRAARG